MNSSFKTSSVKTVFLVFLIQVSFINSVLAQTHAEKIDNLISTYAEYDQFNGSVLIADNGVVIYKKGFGLANKEWDIPNKPDTKHRLGSITKQFTAMVVMQLVEENMLQLHTPISKYLPNYPKEVAEKITVHHLLVHSAGIPNFVSFRKFYSENSRNHFSPEDFVKVFADSTLQFSPGSQFRYSNSNYFLLGYILEKVTGKTYRQLLQDYIFKPLKMNNTGYDNHHTVLNKRASGYERVGFSYVNANYLDMSIPYSAGALYSTVEDMFLWDRALAENTLVSKQTKELIFKPHISTGKRNYGYGWGIGYEQIEGKKDSVNVIEHGGAIDGFHTFITRIPENGQLIVLLNNTGKTYLPEMNKAIRQILYNAEYEKPKQSLAKLLAEILKEEDVKTAEKFYNAHKSDKDIFLSEGEMNALGYELLAEKKIDKAICIFKMAVDAFPQSANVYDSLGEGYFCNEAYELSLVNYQKAVQLGGTYGSAKSMIEKIETILKR